MPNHVFRLLERHQKLDDLLRRAQASRFSHPFEVLRLKKLKLAVKDRLARLARYPPAVFWHCPERRNVVAHVGVPTLHSFFNR